MCRRVPAAAHQCRADVPRRCRGLTEDVTAHAVILRLWGSSASPKRRVMVARQCPMRPPLVRRADGVTENSASPTRRRLYAWQSQRYAPHAVGSTLVLGRDAGGSGVPPARRQQGRVESRHALLRSAYRVMAECRRSATMSAVMVTMWR